MENDKRAHTPGKSSVHDVRRWAASADVWTIFCKTFHNPCSMSLFHSKNWSINVKNFFSFSFFACVDVASNYPLFSRRQVGPCSVSMRQIWTFPLWRTYSGPTEEGFLRFVIADHNISNLKTWFFWLAFCSRFKIWFLMSVSTLSTVTVLAESR